MTIDPRPVRYAASMPPRPKMRPPVGKSGPGTSRMRSSMRRVGRAHEVNGGVDHLAEVVRRDVRRHADGDAVGAVDEQVRDAGRQDHRLGEPVVVVGHEIDAVLVDVGQHVDRDATEAGLRVPVGRGRVAVDRAVVALAVDERVAHREVLREADHRVVDRRVAVRVVLAEHVADDGRALPVSAGRHEPLLVRAVQDAPVHRLEPVAHIGDRSPDDDAHRVVEVRRPHLVLNRDGDLLRRRRRGGRGFCHARTPFLALRRCGVEPPARLSLDRGGPGQKKLPMVNSKSLWFSNGSGASGKPHSNRSGPSGENQRIPKPVEVRRNPRLSGNEKQG